MSGADRRKIGYSISEKKQKECIFAKKRFTGDAKSLIIA
jgi:hypothetical protein